MYAFNKQVSKYVVMVFFSSKISSYSFTCTYMLYICVTAHALCAFSIARPLNARLRIHLAGF